MQTREDNRKSRTLKDISVWSQENGGPSGRNNHSSVVYKNFLIVVGGLDGQYTGNYEDLLIYNIEKNTWKRLIIKSNHKSSPMARYAHSAFLIENTLYVFGGFSQKEGCLNDLCKIELDKISMLKDEFVNQSFQSDIGDDEQIVQFQRVELNKEQSQEIPCARSAFAYQLLKSQDQYQLWIFGGNSTCDFFNDMYYFSFSSMKWTKVLYDQQRSIAIPTPRAGHAMIYFSKPNAFYSFGGGNSCQMFNDVFVFDRETKSWMLPAVQGQSPSGRAGHTATKLNEQYVLLIAGGDLHYVFNDLFLFNIDKNEWSGLKTAGQQPQKRVGHSSSLYNEKILIFGGGDVDGEIFQDMFSLDLSYMVSTQQEVQEQILNQNSRSSRRRAKKRNQKQQQTGNQANEAKSKLKEVQELKSQLKEQNDYMNKQFKIMTNLLNDMQNKSAYFFNKYSKELERLEEKLDNQLSINSESDISESDLVPLRSASTNSTTDQQL